MEMMELQAAGADLPNFLPFSLRSLIWLVMMVGSKRENINTAALVTIVRCNILGFLSHWDLYAVISLEEVAYTAYCNTVEWFWWDWSLSRWPTGFLQCFDAVGLVIWPVKIVLEMTYKVSSGTLSLYSLTHCLIFGLMSADWQWSGCIAYTLLQMLSDANILFFGDNFLS